LRRRAILWFDLRLDRLRLAKLGLNFLILRRRGRGFAPDRLDVLIGFR
jgi:hypothetical protein